MSDEHVCSVCKNSCEKQGAICDTCLTREFQVPPEMLDPKSISISTGTAVELGRVMAKHFRDDMERHMMKSVAERIKEGIREEIRKRRGSGTQMENINTPESGDIDERRED